MVRGSKLGGGGVGVLTGLVSGDRGVEVAERARGGDCGVCSRKTSWDRPSLSTHPDHCITVF